MRMRLAQAWAMVRCEVKMHWRRRGMVVFTVVTAVGVLAFAQAMADSTLGVWADPGSDPSTELVRLATAVAIQGGAFIVALMLIVAVPVLVADTISRDRQIGVRQLLASLPLSRAFYLVGKLLGVWAGLGAGLGAVAALLGLATWLLYGPFDPAAYLLTWLVGLLVLAFYVSGMSALLAAAQPTRRRATFVGLAVAAICLLMMVTPDRSMKDAVSPARPTFFAAFSSQQLGKALGGLMQGSPERASGPPSAEWLWLAPPRPSLVPATVVLAALQVSAAWLVVWLWMERREWE